MTANKDNPQETTGPFPPESRDVSLPQAQFTNSPAAAPSVPEELANSAQYEIIRELGRGGMGVVYLAKNKLMDRLEVLKVINQALMDVPGSLERFLREIRAAAKLNHENVVKAHTAVQIGDLLVFAMEFVEGQDLAKIVKTHGPLPIANACHYARQTALGLQHAHDRQMVHRDIKPQNLILAREGKKHILKILDFGLAKATSEKAVQTQLTGEGKMLGTPDYMAPEQMLDAATADIRADIYSLGCTLYYMLAGTTCFKAKNLMALMLAHQSQPPKPLNEVRADVPEELAAVAAKMMAKDPAQRYQKPSDVAQALLPFIKAGVKAMPNAAAAGTPSAEGSQARSGETSGQADTAPRAISMPRAQKTAGAAANHPAPAAAKNKRTQAATASPMPVSKTGKPTWLWLSAGIGGGLLALTALAVVLWAAGVFSGRAPEGTKPLASLAKAPGPKLESSAEPTLGKKKADSAKSKENPPRTDAQPKDTPPAADGFVSLFNGKDLTGWNKVPGITSPFQWEVRDRAMVTAGWGPQFAHSERGNYRNFHVRLEAKISDGWAGLLEFPSPPPSGKPPKSVKVLFSTSNPFSGSLEYILAKPVKGMAFDRIPVTEPLHQPDQWFSLEMIVDGNRVQTFVNGTKAIDWTDNANSLTEGRLLLAAGLRASKTGGMAIRKIEMKELPEQPLKTFTGK